MVMSPASICGLYHFLLTAAQEVCVRVGVGTLDHHVAALRHRLQHGTRLHPANLDVVEGQVEGARVFDQPVIGDDRNAGVGSGLHGGDNRLGVLCQHDQRVDALRHQAFDIGKLLGRGRLRIGRNIGGTGGFQRRLDRGFVGLPALFLEIRPGNADRLRKCRGGAASQQSGGEKSLFHSNLPRSFGRFWPGSADLPKRRQN